MITKDDKHQFIAMDHCPICGEEVGLVLQTTFTREGRPLHEMSKDICTSFTPCEKCEKEAKELGGVWCYEGEQGSCSPKPTGRVVMLTRDFVQRMFNDDTLKAADKFGYLVFESKLFDYIIKRYKVDNAGGSN